MECHRCLKSRTWDAASPIPRRPPRLPSAQRREPLPRRTSPGPRVRAPSSWHANKESSCALALLHDGIGKARGHVGRPSPAGGMGAGRSRDTSGAPLAASRSLADTSESWPLAQQPALAQKQGGAAGKQKTRRGIRAQERKRRPVSARTLGRHERKQQTTTTAPHERRARRYLHAPLMRGRGRGGGSGPVGGVVARNARGVAHPARARRKRPEGACAPNRIFLISDRRCAARRDGRARDKSGKRAPAENCADAAGMRAIVAPPKRSRFDMGACALSF